MSSEPIIISIDGFASTGKSTLAKKISNYFEYNYVEEAIQTQDLGCIPTKLLFSRSKTWNRIWISKFK